jgi:hypothetical protein
LCHSFFAWDPTSLGNYFLIKLGVFFFFNLKFFFHVLACSEFEFAGVAGALYTDVETDLLCVTKTDIHTFATLPNQFKVN